MIDNRIIFVMPQEDGDILELYSNYTVEDVALMMGEHPVIGMVVNGSVEVHIGYAVFGTDGLPMFSIPVNDHPYVYADLVGVHDSTWRVVLR